MPPVVAAVAVGAIAKTAVFGSIFVTLGAKIVGGAIVGAVIGGATAKLMGQDVKKGALMGAVGGALSAGFVGWQQGAAATSAAPAGAGLDPSFHSAVAQPGVGAGHLTVDPVSGQIGPIGQQGIIAGAQPMSDIDKLIASNEKMARQSTMARMGGQAVKAGAEALLAEDPDENLRRQMELEQARKIEYSGGAPTPDMLPEWGQRTGPITEPLTRYDEALEVAKKRLEVKV